jgi:hypothetical protein
MIFRPGLWLFSSQVCPRIASTHDQESMKLMQAIVLEELSFDSKRVGMLYLSLTSAVSHAKSALEPCHVVRLLQCTFLMHADAEKEDAHANRSNTGH